MASDSIPPSLLPGKTNSAFPAGRNLQPQTAAFRASANTFQCAVLRKRHDRYPCRDTTATLCRAEMHATNLTMRSAPPDTDCSSALGPLPRQDRNISQAMVTVDPDLLVSESVQIWQLRLGS